MLTTREVSKSVAMGRDQLRDIHVVRPEWASNRWAGIEHGELVQAIADRLEERDVVINEERWFVSGANQGDLAGSMNLTIPTMTAPEGTTFSLGVQHSNNGTSSLKFAAGAQVFVCSNGVVTGDFVLKRRHTTGVNLQELIGGGLTTYLNNLETLGDTIERMQGRDLDDDLTDKMLMQAGREELLPWSRIGMVDKEFRNPRFRAFQKRNAWGLYNAFTYVTQKCPAHQQIPSINRFREVVLN